MRYELLPISIIHIQSYVQTGSPESHFWLVQIGIMVV